jgi:hypothetical protein
MRGICGRCRGWRNDALIIDDDWADWLWSDKPMVCVTHKRFVPCRVEDGCKMSTDPVDVEMVRIYQQGSLHCSFLVKNMVYRVFLGYA